MRKNYYVIIGPDSDSGNQQYWNVTEWEWTEDFGAATRYYTGDVFFAPLPPGAECIIEFTAEDKPLRQFDPSTPPPVGGPWQL